MPKNSFTQTDRTHNLCSAGSVIAIQRSSFILNVNFIIVQLLFIIAYTTHRCSGTWTKKISLSSVLFYLIFDGLMLFSLLSYIYIYSIQWARVHVVVFSSFAILSFKFFLSLVVILSAVLYFPHFVSESWMAEEWHSFVNLFMQCSSLNSVIRRPSNIYAITHEISHYFASHFAIIGAPLCTVPSERK